LPRLVGDATVIVFGVSCLKYLALTARRMGADEAQRIARPELAGERPRATACRLADDIAGWPVSVQLISNDNAAIEGWPGRWKPSALAASTQDAREGRQL
jgi:hypothetical protein